MVEDYKTPKGYDVDEMEMMKIVNKGSPSKRSLKSSSKEKQSQDPNDPAVRDQIEELVR